MTCFYLGVIALRKLCLYLGLVWWLHFIDLARADTPPPSAREVLGLEFRGSLATGAEHVFVFSVRPCSIYTSLRFKGDVLGVTIDRTTAGGIFALPYLTSGLFNEIWSKC